MQRAYRHKCAVCLRAAEQHLQGLARWVAPTGGMFLWVELLGVTDAAALLDQMVAEKVLVVPGSYFHHSGTSGVGTGYRTPYVRVSFAFEADEVLVEGFRRLGAVLRKRQ